VGRMELSAGVLVGLVLVVAVILAATWFATRG
jgi:hypothetical protein